jgi:hypothetical protein
MPAPATLPDFATDATYAADGDAWSGDATKVDPGAPIRAEGFEPGTLEAERVAIRVIVDAQAGLKVIQIAAIEFNGHPEWTAGSAGEYWSSAAASKKLWIDLNKILPHGTSISRVRALINPASNVNAAGSRMEMRILRSARNFGTPAVPTGTVLVTRTGGGGAVTVGTMEDDGTGAIQVLDTAALGSPIAIDRGAHSIVVEILSSVDVAADLFYGLEVAVALPSVRNY